VSKVLAAGLLEYVLSSFKSNVGGSSPYISTQPYAKSLKTVPVCDIKTNFTVVYFKSTFKLKRLKRTGMVKPHVILIGCLCAGPHY